VLAKNQSTEIRYFGYSIGGTVPGGAAATKVDTNLLNGNGQLGAAEEMLIYSMRVILPPDISLGDIQDLLAKTYTAFYIAAQKPSAEGRLEFFPAGGGISGVTTRNEAEAWTNGAPQSIASRVFATPHYLAGTVTFWAAQEFSAALAMAAARRVCIVLDGLRKRPVT